MSANVFELNCTVRTDLGKGASRRLRRLEATFPPYFTVVAKTLFP